MIALRPYCEADLPALHALDQVCFAPGIAYSRAELRAFLIHPSSFTVVAVAEEQMVGFAIVRPMRSRTAAVFAKQYEPALHLITIDVAPEARRLGVGSLLMHWVLTKADELAAKRVLLEVAVDNFAAQHFYERFGFTQSGILTGYYNGVIDALRLERVVVSTDRAI